MRQINAKKTYPQTFNSFDTKKSDEFVLYPHGPDPVFYGIRGENVDSLLLASKDDKSEKIKWIYDLQI